jgi:hypothetical protein
MYVLYLIFQVYASEYEYQHSRQRRSQTKFSENCSRMLNIDTPVKRIALQETLTKYSVQKCFKNRLALLLFVVEICEEKSEVSQT